MKKFGMVVMVFLTTYIAQAQSPGGVNPGESLKFWVKADAGLTTNSMGAVTHWANSADNTKNMISSGISPVLPTTDNYMNFNPAVKFVTTSPANGTLYTTATILPSNSNFSRFVVFNDTSANTGSANMLGSGAPPPNARSGSIAFYKPGAGNTVTQWVGGINNYGNTAGFSQNIPQIGTSVSTFGPSPVNYIRINGVQNVVSNANVGYLDANVQIGATYNLGGAMNVNFFYGYIPEAIIYSTALTATEIKKVESYLAVKYGTTLSGDYLTSDGTVIWTSELGFDNNIAGIGRDQSSALYQKQSMSVNSGSQLAVSVSVLASTNAANLNTISSDKQYFIWSDNGGLIRFNTSTGLLNYPVHLGRVWKAQRTNGFAEDITIHYPVSAFGSVPAAKVGLIYGSQAASLSDGTGTIIVQSGTVTIEGISYYVFNVPSGVLANMQYFSFAAAIPTPGGVPGATMWLRADKNTAPATDGGALSQWDDQTLNGNNAVQATAAFQPTFRNNTTDNLNFNPTIKFDVTGTVATADYLMTGNLGLPGQLNAAIFTVGGLGSYLNPIPQGMNFGTNSIEFVASNVRTTRMHLAGGTPGDANGSYSPTTGPLSVAGPASIHIGWRNSGAFSAGVNSQVVATSGTGTTTPFTNFNLQIGRAWENRPSPTYIGNIPEEIVFPISLSTFESQKVNSYLAIKYGITLSRDNDKDLSLGEVIAPGFNEGDYFASNGTRIWTDNSGHGDNVAGIGRDDLTALLQKQSASINSATQIIMSRGPVAATNALNTGSFSNDLQYLVWGDNNVTGVTAFSFGKYTLRSIRRWRVNRTGVFGATDDIQLYIPQSFFSGTGYKVSLMYNTNDLGFGSGNQFIESAGIVTFNGVDYYNLVLPASMLNANANFYMALVGYVLAPGGVLGESLWLRADAQSYGDGISIDGTRKWIATTGKSAGQYEAQYASGAKPVFKKGAWNFNPAVRFNLGAIGADYLNTGDSITTFTALNNKGISGGQGPSPAGEVRVLSMTGSTNADFSLGGLIPVLGGNPLRTMTNGTANIANFTANTLNGVNPGIATSMRTPINSAAAGNTTSTLYAQWNGSAPATTSSSTRFNVDYYVLGGLAKGSQTIETDRSFFTGDIPEVIVYSNDLTAVQRQRINSYLSIKYGVTLDQTSAQNYLATDGTTVYWNASGAHATFKNNIAGIGMDNMTGLLQKQGQSINTGDQVVISLSTVAATNETNAGTFSADKQYLVWGDDAGPASTTIAVTGFGAARLRMLRKWELQNTGNFNQQVTVYYPTAAFTTVFGSRPNYLIYDNAPTFNGTAKTSILAGGTATINGVSYTAFTVTFPTTGTLYFSFGTNDPSPVLTVGGAECSGTGTYSVTFNSNGTVTASAGTMSGNSITSIPLGTNVTITASSAGGAGTTTALVNSPASCPISNGCTPPALTAGQGVCNGGGTYSVAFSATAGATIAVSPVSATVSGNTVTAPVGTNVTITATLGGCSSSITVNSPVDCSTACATPAASFSAGTCTGATYTVNVVKTSTAVLTASTGTVTGGGSGSTSGTISGVATGTAIIATVTETGCSVQNITINAPSNTAPVLTASNAVCSGTGTYSVSFSSNGIVTASAGTVSGNSVTGIPVGTNVTLTAKSTNGCGTTTAVVPSPASCPSSNGCTPPALTAGQGVCGGTGYSVAFSATSGASISISSGTLSGNTVTGVTLGTSLTITATLGGCSSSITVNSPVDCSTACATPAASFSAGTCTGATYTVNVVKTSTAVLTASTGTVTGGGAGSTSGTISGVATGTSITATISEPSCSFQTITIQPPSKSAPLLSVGSGVCNGSGNYSIIFNSNGIVTASAGTVSGNTVTDIPVGTNVVLTSTAVNNCATTTAEVTAPANCPASNTCTPPVLSAGNGICNGAGAYNVTFYATPGSSVMASSGNVTGNTITDISVGTDLYITATTTTGTNTCATVIRVKSPVDCNTSCEVPSASFSQAISNGTTYKVVFTKSATSVITATAGTVTNGGFASTSGTITGIPVGTHIIASVSETGCSSVPYTIFSPAAGVVVNLKVFLQGAMSGTSMTTTLRNAELIPANQPYNVSPWNYNGSESVILSSMPANLTDWVLVELRDAAAPATVIATRAAFLLSNGNVVDIDGVSALNFPSVGAGEYFISIRHRNHLGIRTATPQYLKSTSSIYDFTTTQLAAYQNGVILSNGGLNDGNPAMKELVGGLFTMWGGNANSNNNVRLSGPANDQSYILNVALGGNATNVLANVYNNADLNLNGVVRSSGPNNEPNFLQNFILGGNLNLVILQHL
ncbi:MAG: hypothetical protein NTW29_19370 [Bacteroidetes bacterium]|nr:hypothetical protein [Bacteroidota bacterium]